MKKSVKIAIFFAVYFLAAKAGLIYNVNQFASIVWAPTGLSLAVLLLFGRDLWPAIFLGAFAANFSVGASITTALGMACGNTLEALVGAYLCLKTTEFHPSLRRRRDAVALIVKAALFSTLISAIFGIGSLWLTGVLATEQVGYTWLQWWVGDVISDLTLAPAILVFATAVPVKRFLWNSSSWLEKGSLATIVVALSILVFGGSEWMDFLSGHKVYLIVPPLLWAALRFGQRGATFTNLAVSAFAIGFTAYDVGPFTAAPSPSSNLIHL